MQQSEGHDGEATEDLEGATEGGNAATEESDTGNEVTEGISDREEGGPTSGDSDEEATGGAHGTRPSEMESHD